MVRHTCRANFFMLFALLFCFVPSSDAAKCLYISSYHKGYEWNDGIERGLEAELKGQCVVQRPKLTP